MKRILSVLIFSILVNATAFGENVTIRVGNANQEDTFASSGGYDANGFDNAFGWHYFGYSIYTRSYYDAYWRWALDIPQGSTVTGAYVRIRADYTNSGTLDAAFRALVPDGKWETDAAFSTVNYPNGTALNGIPVQGPEIAWNDIPVWMEGIWYDGPDISSLVQTRVDNPDYDPNDSQGKYFGLVLYYVSGSWFRTGTQEPDDDSLTAVLYVEWTPPVGNGCEPGAVEICGDGIDNNCNGEIDEFCNECPTADVGPDQIAYVGDMLQLDGSGSADADGDPLSYTWSLIMKPVGSTAGLSDPTALMPTFMVDVPGVYAAELVVNDGTCDSQSDTCVITGMVLEFTCPSGHGFWKSHRDAWPVDSLKLGGETYTKNELLAIFKMPVRGDASRTLARQLIAAKLNIADGSDPEPASDTIASADSLLGEFAGKLPYNIRPSAPAGRLMIHDAQVLNTYNNGWLTADCDL
ncbi:MAG: putative metal-binding motif-containing protein [Candidatus Hydrogenedentota bacterium]|nr:MAG: putative metal-binding motif-containing protein [Candidatus Hydrogenedentota bacterium]